MTTEKKEKEKSDRSWGGSSEFSNFSGSLGMSSGNDFQRAIAPFVRVIFPSLAETPNLDHLDTAGLDYVIWSDDYTFPVAIQAKGWQVSAEKLGYSQIQQCKKSLLSLKKRKDVHVTRYIIIHNRDHRSEIFRKGIEALIQEHTIEKTADHIEVWDRRTLLNKVFNSMHDRLLVALSKDSKRRAALGLDLIQSIGGLTPVTNVPLSSVLAKTDQFQLTLNERTSRLFSDPAKQQA